MKTAPGGAASRSLPLKRLRAVFSPHEHLLMAGAPGKFASGIPRGYECHYSLQEPITL